jgi:hypothetical protein
MTLTPLAVPLSEGRWTESRLGLVETSCLTFASLGSPSAPRALTSFTSKINGYYSRRLSLASSDDSEHLSDPSGALDNWSKARTLGRS